MKTNLYTILDKVAADHGPIFQAVNHGVARRNYNNLLKQVPETIVEDYELYHIGFFDTDTGELEIREKTQVSTRERDFIEDNRGII